MAAGRAEEKKSALTKIFPDIDSPLEIDADEQFEDITCSVPGVAVFCIGTYETFDILKLVLHLYVCLHVL